MVQGPLIVQKIFTQLCTALSVHFDTFPGGWLGQINNIDHLSPAKTKTWPKFDTNNLITI